MLTEDWCCEKTTKVIKFYFGGIFLEVLLKFGFFLASDFYFSMKNEYLVRDINSPIFDFLTKYLLFFCFLINFLYWHQLTFSKSWKCFKMYFTTSLKKSSFKILLKRYSWFGKNRLVFWCHEQDSSSKKNTNVPKIFILLLLTFFILDMANLSCAKRNFLKISQQFVIFFLNQEKIVKIGDFSFRILVILLQQHDLATKTTQNWYGATTAPSVVEIMN